MWIHAIDEAVSKKSLKPACGGGNIVLHFHVAVPSKGTLSPLSTFLCIDGLSMADVM